MKTQPEIVAIINKHLDSHKKSINMLIEELQTLKGKKELTDNMKLTLVKYATMIAENKAAIMALDKIKQEIEK